MIDLQQLTFDIIHPVKFLHSGAFTINILHLHHVGLVFSKGNLENVKST